MKAHRAAGRAVARTGMLRVYAIATSERLKPFSSVARSISGLSWTEMHHASQLARLAGYCYHPTEELADLTKAEGLKLVASGRTPYTSWYVADGELDQHHFYRKACTQWAPAALSHDAAHSSNGNGHQRHLSSNGASTSAAAAGAAAATAGAGQQQWPAPPPGKRCRFVFVRGVQWGAHDGDMSAVTQALMSFWPTPFPPPAASAPASSSGTAAAAATGTGTAAPAPAPAPSGPAAAAAALWSLASSNPSLAASLSSVASVDESAPPPPPPPPPPPLVAHTGVSRLAMDLYAALQPYLMDQTLAAPSPGGQTARAGPQQQQQQQQQQGRPQGQVAGGPGAASPSSSPSSAPELVCLAGHSMGGALAMVTLARCILAGHRRPEQLSCHTFGSPPVLAHRDGGGGHRVLEELGLGDNAVRSFVLEHDPVPRALITADPAFQALKRYEPIRQLLDWRGWWVNSSAMGSRFMALLGVAPPEAHKPLQSPIVSANRFMFENVGSVYLIKGGAELVPVGAASDVEEIMRLAVNELASQPQRAIQAWLDHHHTSYSHDLQTAALAELKRGLRKARGHWERHHHASTQHAQHAQHAQQELQERAGHHQAGHQHQLPHQLPHQQQHQEQHRQQVVHVQHRGGNQRH